MSALPLACEASSGAEGTEPVPSEATEPLIFTLVQSRGGLLLAGLFRPAGKRDLLALLAASEALLAGIAFSLGAASEALATSK